MAEGEQDLDKSNSNNAIQARQKKADDAAKRFMDEPKYNNSTQDRQKKADHAAKRFMQGVTEGADDKFSVADKVEELVDQYRLYDKRGWTDLFAKLAGRKLEVAEIRREMEYASKFLQLLDSIRMRSDYRGQQDPRKDQELIDLSNQWLSLFNKATSEFKGMSGQGVAEDWNKVNHHDKTDGMSGKAVKAYRRENPGSKLKTAVTTKPSKLKAGSKAANRRKSFCARMGGNKGPMKKPNGKPTPKALALRRWNCESIEELQELLMLAEQFVNKKKNESI
jgi:hypothetical protein